MAPSSRLICCAGAWFACCHASEFRVGSVAITPSYSSRIDSVDELELGGENSTGDVGSEEEGAARGGVNLQSRLRQAFASRISDIDGGEGDNGRHVERAVWIVRSGHRR